MVLVSLGFGVRVFVGVAVLVFAGTRVLVTVGVYVFLAFVVGVKVLVGFAVQVGGRVGTVPCAKVVCHVPPRKARMSTIASSEKTVR